MLCIVFLEAALERSTDSVARWELAPIGSWRVSLSNGINTLPNVPTFRILLFRSDRLERWSEIEAADAVEAIQLAAQLESEGTVELWSDQGKLATLRPVGRHG
jgi:hypothetical protein